MIYPLESITPQGMTPVLCCCNPGKIHGFAPNKPTDAGHRYTLQPFIVRDEDTGDIVDEGYAFESHGCDWSKIEGFVPYEGSKHTPPDPAFTGLELSRHPRTPKNRRSPLATRKKKKPSKRDGKRLLRSWK